MDITIQVPDADLSEVLKAVAAVWEADARAAEPGYGELTDAEKLAACLAAEASVRTRNVRREAAERALEVAAPIIERKGRARG